jgi:hypothetical protein
MSEERDDQARRIREALEAQLGEKVEAAGVFKRGSPGYGGSEAEVLLRPIDWLYERLTKGRIGRLRGTFLLAVTSDKVRASTFRRGAPNLGVHKRAGHLRPQRDLASTWQGHCSPVCKTGQQDPEDRAGGEGGR